MFVVMPYFRNGTLEGHRARFQGNSLEALRAILQVLEALCYLHDKGVAHRDLKPSNILIDDQGSLVVSDFGLAYDEHAIESVTQPGERVGNWQFCPDWEYLEQDYARNKLVDCYACAKVLWWMLSGGSVLRREDWNLPRFNLAGLFPGDPGMTAVNRILEKALASTPSDMKYNSARAMRDDVGAEIDSLVTRRVVPGSAPRQCRACQSGVYARAQGIHLSDFENWKTDMNRAAAPADKIVGVDVYRCRDCGHIAVYATHDRTGSA
jgi:serine/threonine protein kinase